jgi:DcuC family C4-dicarboxylate transporter
MHFLAILIILLTIIPVVRRYQTQATLILSGFSLLTLAWVFSAFSGKPIHGLEQSLTGWFVFDLFALVENSLTSRAAGVGMIIMAAGGFARYMSAISASTALVNLAVQPLSHIRNPYILLALAYVVGQILNIFVPSAAGLAMLLLVAMYPTLVKLGLRPSAVAAVIGTTACLDLGPASAASNVAATVSGYEPVVYFVRYQIPVALVVIPVVAFLHFIWQRHCDRREPESESDSVNLIPPEGKDQPPVPNAYALIPLLPPTLLIIFSPLVVSSVQIGVVTAMLFALGVGIVCEGFRLRDMKAAMAGIVHFFKGMGDIFAKVVTLIVAAEIFATGVQATGLIDMLLGLVEETGSGVTVMTIALIILIGLTTLLTGSGNAALFSFSNIIPSVAKPMGVETVVMMLPCQLVSGLFRSMSPVAGVVIAVASVANVSPFAIVRRTAIPMLGGVIATLIANALIF